MDSLQKLIVALLLTITLPAFAAFPAEPSRNGWINPNPDGTPRGGMYFDSAAAAANWACQSHYSLQTHTSQVVTAQPAGPNGAGLDASGRFYSAVTCYFANGTTGTVPNMVRNPADCKGTGAPMVNFAPATCSGDPPSSSSSTAEQCALTAGVVIPAALKTASPVSLACYAGCQYTPTITSTVTYNGMSYQEGNWKGNGKTCAGSEPIMYGGTADNSGGITAGDLARLNQEVTQKQVLAVLKSIEAKTGTGTTGGSTTNPQIDVTNSTLEQIRAADQAARDDRSDPDGLEATWEANKNKGAFDGVPTSTFDVGATFAAQNGFLPGQCPPGPKFSVRGKEYQFDVSLICNLASGISYLVIAIATLAGVRIFIGAR